MTGTGDVAVVVDIGGTKMAVGLMTMAGELIDREQAPGDHDVNAKSLYAVLDVMIQSQLERARGHHQLNPVVVGIGCAGPLTPTVVPSAPPKSAVAIPTRKPPNAVAKNTAGK